MCAQNLVVVIPHYRRVDLLRRALSSTGDYPVIVVDDSVDGLQSDVLQDVEAGPPVVSVLRAAGASGFSVVANRGLAAAEGQGFTFALVLNDDTELEEGAVERLMEAMLLDERVGAAGPVLFGPHGVESAGISVSAGRARVRHKTDIPSRPTEVDALSGACLLLKTDQRFDEQYPFYFEDIALCLALREQGKTVVVVPEARCHHVGGATIDRRSRQAAARAVEGHLRLVGAAWYWRTAVVGLALLQILKERGPVSRVRGVWEGMRSAS